MSLLHYPKVIKILFTAIIIPLLAAYTVVIYAYFIKILINWSLPKGVLGHLVLWYVSIMIYFIFKKQVNLCYMISGLIALMQAGLLKEGKIIANEALDEQYKNRISDILMYFDQMDAMDEVDLLEDDFTIDDMEAVFGFPHRYRYRLKSGDYVNYRFDEAIISEKISGADYMIDFDFNDQEQMIEKDLGDVLLKYDSKTQVLTLVEKTNIIIALNVGDYAKAIHEELNHKDPKGQEDMKIVCKNEEVSVRILFERRKKMRKFVSVWLSVLIFLILNYNIGFANEFQDESVKWEFVNDAYYDALNDCYVLTESEDWQVGGIWYDYSVNVPFTIDFSYYAGDGNGSLGQGDGFVFVFSKDKKYNLQSGGTFGFNGIEGYGVEFDSFQNAWDTNGDHIALIHNNVNNHLISKNSDKVKDAMWHDARIVITESNIQVYVDEENIFNWNGDVVLEYSNIGFLAGTGLANNSHYIKDVHVTSDVFEDSLIYYEFEGYADDSSGNDYYGIEYGDVKYIDGVIGKAAKLSSASDYIGISKDVTIDGDFTASFWTKLDKKAGDFNMFVQGANASEDNILNLAWRNRDEKFECYFNGNSKYSTNSYNLLNNRWNLITYCNKGGIVKLYVNGSLFHTYDFTNINQELEIEYLVIGKDQDYLAGGYQDNQSLFGSIDEMIICEYALEADDVSNYYNHVMELNRPELIYSSPNDGERYVSINKEIALMFSGNTLSRDTINNNNFVLMQGDDIVDADISYDENDNIVIIMPLNDLLPSTPYCLEIQKEVYDIIGQSLWKSYRINFVSSNYKYQNDTIQFESIYPNSNTEPSEVMKGGKVYRYYKIVTPNGTPYRNYEIIYKYNHSNKQFTGISDNDGIIRIETASMFNTQDLELVVLNDKVALQVPNFRVNVTDREFIQHYSLRSGLTGEIGAGVGFDVNIGSLVSAEANIVDISLAMSKDNKQEISYFTKGDKMDMAIESTNGKTMDTEVSLLQASLWKDSPSSPTVTIINNKTELVKKEGSRLYCEDFGNPQNAAYREQMLNSSIYLIESAAFSNKQINPILYEIYKYLLEKSDLGGNREYIYETGGMNEGKVGLGLEFPVGTKTGHSNISFASHSKEFTLIGGEYAINNKLRIDHEEGEYEIINEMYSEMKGIFTNEGEKEESAFYGQALNFTQSIDGIQTISMWREREEISGLLGYSKTKTSLSGVAVEQSSDMNQLTNSSNFVNALQHSAGVELQQSTFNQFVKDVNQYTSNAHYFQKNSNKESIDVPVKISVGAGVKVGVGFNIEGVYELEYMTNEGKRINGIQYQNDYDYSTLASYNYDNIIIDHEKEFYQIIDEYGEFIGEEIVGIVNVISDGIENGVQVVCDSVSVAVDSTVDSVTGIYENSQIMVTNIKNSISGKNYYLAYSVDERMNSIYKNNNVTVNGDGDATINSLIFGEGIIVKLLDENNQEISEFEDNPLEIAFDYSYDVLRDAGFDIDDANKLSIFYWDEHTEYYVNLVSYVDIQNHKVSAEITREGQYYLAIDIGKPEISDVEILASNKYPIIKWNMRDYFSGIDFDSFVMRCDDQLMIDGSDMLNYYDIITGEFSYIFENELSDGAHVIELTVSDNAGNSSDTITFTIEVDQVKPVISSVQEQINSNGDILITAQVTDNIDINQVYVCYKYANLEGHMNYLEMSNIENNIFTASIASDDAVHNVEITVYAIDGSNNKCTLLKTIDCDCLRPTIEQVSINNGDPISSDEQIEILFSEPIKYIPTDLNDIKVHSTFGTENVDIVCLDDKISIINKFGRWEEGATYTLDIPIEAITDIDGNRLLISDDTNRFSIDFRIESLINDYNGNEYYDLTDLTKLTDWYGSDASLKDMNEDGVIDILDLLLVCEEIE